VHGVSAGVLREERRCPVERCRLDGLGFGSRPSEGRQRVYAGVERFATEVVLPRGTLIVSPAQPAVRVLAHLLEPESEDALVRWGFFNALFERQEYAEDHVMEPLARAMLLDDEDLREEFFARLEDVAFRDDPAARLEFFFRRSAHFDPTEELDPILRIVDARAYRALLSVTREAASPARPRAAPGSGCRRRAPGGSARGTKRA
jgi:hypothetical protein